MTYSVEKKSINAAFPRYPGSTVSKRDRLKVVYLKYQNDKKFASDDIKVNLVFAHGTGMNKLIWKYLIGKLYENSDKNGWNLNCVIALDAVGHGDSALANQGKLGHHYKWDDGSKDIIQVLRYEIETTGHYYNDAFNKTICVGHSMGGFQTIVAAYLEPSLFDAIIPIEAVCYLEPAMRQKFTKIFSKIYQLLIDNFDSQEEVNKYFKEMSFFKVFAPEVMEDFLKDEIYTEIDPETKEIRYKVKSSTANQVVAYLGSGISIDTGMACLPLLTCGVCHVIGEEAKWNPPQSISFIRGSIPKHLLDVVDMPKGEHLVNAQLPDETASVIVDYISKRIDLAQKNKGLDPEVMFNGDREKILKHYRGLHGVL